MSKEEVYCFNCDILIKKDSFIEFFDMQRKSKPTKYKQGWLCGECHNKKLKGEL